MGFPGLQVLYKRLEIIENIFKQHGTKNKHCFLKILEIQPHWKSLQENI